MVEGPAIIENMDEETEFIVAKLIEIGSTDKIISVEDQVNENKRKRNDLGNANCIKEDSIIPPFLKKSTQI